MKHRLAPLALAFSLMLMTQAAQAHTALLYYAAWWKAHPVVNYGFVNPNIYFPNGADRAWTAAEMQRVRDGAAAWTAITPTTFTYNEVSTILATTEPTQCPYSENNGLWWDTIDGAYVPGSNPPQGAVAGRTLMCVFNADRTKLAGFQIRFDVAENWYFGTGSPGSNQIDFASVATHELGHAAGHTYHWDDPGFNETVLCGPSDPARETMCASTVLGQSVQRTLGGHDRHTFDETY